MSKKVFVIKRVETVNYWLDWDRDELIENLAWSLSEGDEAAEKALAERYSQFTDAELLAFFKAELYEYGDVFDYVIDRSEKYGDVQSQDVTVTLERIGE